MFAMFRTPGVKPIRKRGPKRRRHSCITSDRTSAKPRGLAYRRLSCEPLEERTLLTWNVPGWTDPVPSWATADDVICEGKYDATKGYVIDVFVEILDVGFETPSSWKWQPACLSDPIIDLSNLHTGFEMGFSFTINRTPTEQVFVSNTSYVFRGEVLDPTPDMDHPVFDYVLPAERSGPIDLGFFSGSYQLSFAPQFNSALEPVGLSATASIELDGSKKVTLVEYPAIGIPLVGAFSIGVFADITLDLDANVRLALTDGFIGVDSATIEPALTIGLSGFGKITALGGWVGEGTAWLGGTLKQDLTAEFTSDKGWSLAAPGSLNLTGGYSYKFLAGLKEGSASFSFPVGSWDFIHGTNPSPAPDDYSQPQLPVVTLANGFSTDLDYPTHLTHNTFVVSASASAPSGISENGVRFITRRKVGGEWASEIVWGSCNGTDTIGPLEDGVYMLQVLAKANDGTVGLSDEYYFSIDTVSAPGGAPPRPGDALELFHVRWRDNGLNADGDGVIEGGERVQLEVALHSNENVSNVDAYLSSELVTAEVRDDYVSYGAIARNHTTWGNDDFDIHLHMSEYSGLPLVLRVNYQVDGQQYYQSFRITTDVYLQGDYVEFRIDDPLDYTMDDSPSLFPTNDGDGIFESGERVAIRPRLRYNGIATATDVEAFVRYAGDAIYPQSGDEPYPNMSPGAKEYPEGNNDFKINANVGFAGSVWVDVQVECDQSPEPILLQRALRLDVHPAAYYTHDREWNFGVASPGDAVTYAWTVRNPGTAVLHVTDIVSSHPDTTVDTASFDIPPHSSRVVTVTIDTSNLQGDVSRTLQIVCDGRPLDEEDRTLTITGFVSEQADVMQLPGPVGYNVDVSLPWIVWDAPANGMDIFAYNIVTRQLHQITDHPANQRKPRIDGNLIVWEDDRNGDAEHYDIYGYDLATGQEIAIANDPANERLVGVDSGIVAFMREYHRLTEPASYPVLYNLWVHDNLTGQDTNLTGFTANTSHQDMYTVSGPYDFEGGMLLWGEFTTYYWQGPYGSAWMQKDKRIKMWPAPPSGNPVLTEPPYDVGGLAADGESNRFVWYEWDNSEGIWQWRNGAMSKVADVGAGYLLATRDGILVSYNRQRPADGVFYWDLDHGNTKYLLTDVVDSAEHARMDEHCVVWYGRDRATQQYHLYYAFIHQPDVAVDFVGIAPGPLLLEGQLIDIEVIVSNITDHHYDGPFTIRLYDGDPNEGGTLLRSIEWGNGLPARSSERILFPGVIVPENAEGAFEQEHRFVVTVSVPGYDPPENNTAYQVVMVCDDDTDGPVISDVTLSEIEGDGDGIVGLDEKLRISWKVTDQSNVGEVRLLVDGEPQTVALSDGIYYATLTPTDLAKHKFQILASDADNSPAWSTYEGAFQAVPPEDITLLYLGRSIDGSGTTPIDVGVLPFREETPLLFVVRNDGAQSLAIHNAKVKVGEGNANLECAAPTSLADAESVVLTLRPDTTIPGPFSYEVQIDSSDPDENPFVFTVTGSVAAPPFPIVCLDASGEFLLEPGGTLALAVSRIGPTENELLVQLQVGGTAARGVDYELFADGRILAGEAITIAPGQAQAIVELRVLDDEIVESAETVVLAVRPNSDYEIGVPSVATVVLRDNDGPNAFGTITGAVWHDRNGNGLRDSAEEGLAGWTIYLDTNSNGQLDDGEPYVVTLADDPATTEDETGQYIFANVQPGSYIVRQVPDKDWLQTSPSSGTYELTVTVGDYIAGVDFGNWYRWRLAYATDFSEDPGWVTNAASHWDSSTETYYIEQLEKSSGNGYAVVDVGPVNGSFRLEWDILVEQLNGITDVAFGLNNDTLDSSVNARCAQVLFGIHGNPILHVRVVPEWNAWVVDPHIVYSLNVWYHVTLEYDADAKTVRATITERDSGRAIGELVAENIVMPEDSLRYVGNARSWPGDYGSGEKGIGRVDNVALFVSVSPPRLAGVIATPNPSKMGQQLTLIAISASDERLAISDVRFYRDRNGNGLLDVGEDEFLGIGHEEEAGWVWTGPITWEAGSHTYFAVATNGVGLWSNVVVGSSLVLQADDEYEPNDSLGSAFDLTRNEGRWLSTVNGRGIQQDDDWYRVYVTPGYENLVVDCSSWHSEGDVRIALYDGQGDLLYADSAYPQNMYINTIVPEGGRYYYIRVYGGNDGSTYDLWWDDVQPVNKSPKVELLNLTTTLAENIDTTSRLKVADVVITDDSFGSNTLSLSGRDAALFEIDGSELYLKAGVVLDFEADATLDVTVNVDDPTVGAYPDDSVTLSISVTDVNEPPSVSLANTTSALPENLDTSSRCRVGDIVITDDALGTNILSLTGPDAALFELDGLGLYLISGAALDFESNPVLDVTIGLDDPAIGVGPDDRVDLSIVVTDVNEPPRVDLANATSTLPENTDTASRFKVADIVITDDAVGNNTLSVVGPDAALFEVDGLGLYLKPGVVLDFEDNPVLDVTLQVDDPTVGTDPDGTAGLSIDVTDVNEVPTLITLSSMAVPENQPSGTLVGILSTLDPDHGETFVYSLVGGTGDEDNGLFTIVGDQLLTAACFDFEARDHYSIRIRSTDQGGLWREQSFVVAVTNIYEPPQVVSVVASPDSVVIPGALTLAAEVATDSSTDVIQVEFYDGDMLLFSDTDGSDGYTWTGSTAGWAQGLHTVLARVEDTSHSWSELKSTTVTIELPPGDFGTVDYYSVRIDPSALPQISFTAKREGLLTVQALGTAPANFSAVLLDKDYQVLANSSPINGMQRIDYPTQAGQQFLLQVTGAAGAVDLTIVNLVQQLGDTVTVFGSDGDDVFEFDAAGSRTVTVNGVAYHFDDQQAVETRFVGSSGNDQLFVRSTDGPETAWLAPAMLDMHGAGYNVYAEQIPRVFIDGRGGNDWLGLADSNGDDVLQIGPSAPFAAQSDAVIAGTTAGGVAFENSVAGFEKIDAIASGGGGDTVIFYGSRSGGDKLWVYPGYSSMLLPGLCYMRAFGFENIEAHAGAGGTAQAIVRSGSGDDQLTARPDMMEFTVADPADILPLASVQLEGFSTVLFYGGGGEDSVVLDDGGAGESNTISIRTGNDITGFYGPGYKHWYVGFEQVDVTLSDRKDRAYLHGHDGPETFTFYADPTSPDQKTQVVGIAPDGRQRLATVMGAGSLKVYAGDGGQDIARFYDSSSTAERYWAGSEWASMQSVENVVKAYGFDGYEAYFTAGSGDSVTLFDRQGTGDRLDAEPNRARFIYAGQADHYSQAQGFDNLYATASDNQDVLMLSDGKPGEANTLSYAASNSTTDLAGPGYRHWFRGFDRIEVTLSDLADKAYLHGHSGSEVFTFYADPASPDEKTQLTGTRTDGKQTSATVSGAGSILVFFGDGGHDVAHFYDSLATADRFWAGGGWASMQAAGVFVKVEGLDVGEAHFSGGGSGDQASLHDSSTTADLLEAQPGLARLVYGADNNHYVRSTGHQLLRAFASGATTGQDVAQLYPQAGSIDQLQATFDRREVIVDGPGYSFGVSGFRRVEVHANAGDSDVAQLYDSPGNEHLEADGEAQPSLATLSNADLLLELWDFSRIEAVSDHGGDDTKHIAYEALLDFVLETTGSWRDV